MAIHSAEVFGLHSDDEWEKNGIDTKGNVNEFRKIMKQEIWIFSKWLSMYHAVTINFVPWSRPEFDCTKQLLL